MTPEERLDRALSAAISQDVTYRKALLDMLRAALADEREACAVMVERHNGMGGNKTLAAAIRART